MQRVKLFNHLKNVDSSTLSFLDKLSVLTRKCYPKSSDLMYFDEKKYRNLYRQWGEMGIFNHCANMPRYFGRKWYINRLQYHAAFNKFRSGEHVRRNQTYT
jgi:hypothetical protein